MHRITYRAFADLLLLGNRHFPIVKHAPNIIIQRQQLLVQRLRQYIHLVLQVRPLLSQFLIL